VVNISEGGALLKETNTAVEKPYLKDDQMIRDIRLTGMDDGHKFEIKISKSLVRRVFKDSDTGKYHYALQFLDMDPQDRLAIGQWIFRCQREVLRRRNLLEVSE
jgi:c-di-GMP-binding flagellar brake protein YcgR